MFPLTLVQQVLRLRLAARQPSVTTLSPRETLLSSDMHHVTCFYFKLVPFSHAVQEVTSAASVKGGGGGGVLPALGTWGTQCSKG